MDWFLNLFLGNSIPTVIVVLSVTISLGLVLGSVKFLGMRLGVGGVMFSGLILGQLGFTIDHEMMEFVREFGLVLFVYALGLQVGPGFFASLRRQGMAFNAIAAAIVLGGTAVALVIAYLAQIDLPAAVGMLCGAVTNTPSLGSAQQAVKQLPQGGVDAAQVIGLGYAVAYPFGIVGIIATMALLRRLFNIDPQKEAAEFERRQVSATPLKQRNIEVQNPNLVGKSLDELAELVGQGVVVSRFSRGEQQHLATDEVALQLGDVLHAVGTQRNLESFRVIVGKESAVKIPQQSGVITARRIIVTQKDAAEKKLSELALRLHFNVVLTRVIRSGLEFAPTSDMRVHIGDRLMLVGRDKDLDRAAAKLGDSIKALDTPHIVPIFVGITLGLIVGSIPFHVPYIPAPIKLGLAGGPLIVAIVMGRIGKIGPLLSYMPNPAKDLLREVGIALFLACVGLKSGERFAEVLLHGDGLYWMGLAALITFVPLFSVAVYARAVKKINYVSLCGVLAGSTTDPPALSYATQLSGNDAPSIAYATVYPLTMLLRVIIAQAIVIIGMG